MKPAKDATPPRLENLQYLLPVPLMHSLKELASSREHLDGSQASGDASRYTLLDGFIKPDMGNEVKP
jgi:hypothetical protein